jgi:hypothetical protein
MTSPTITPRTTRAVPARAATALIASILTAPALLTPGCAEADDAGPADAEQQAAPTISLVTAVAQGDDEAVRAHIAAGTPVNTPNATGDTPLSVAAVFGRASAAGALIDAGAELESRNNSGVTPLFNAAFFCHPDVVRLLIDAGADTTTTDQHGTPIRQIMQTPWVQIEPVYAAIYSAIGITLDEERIEATRPTIAEMLR